MGVSTDGQLTFGILLPEDENWEWNEEEYATEFDDWYSQKFTGWHLEYDGTDDYFVKYRDHLKQYPVPFEIVTHCSYDYPMYVLAVKGKTYYNSRGYPEQINPENLTVTEEEIEKITHFARNELGLDEIKIGWWLTSLWR